MSYDIYCYKSKLDRPDLDEAIAVIEIDEDEVVISDPETKLRIAKALIDYNPRLESFDFDYEEIAKFRGLNVDQAKEAFDHIELNTPEGDFATQITIFDNNVSITVPYWYSGNESNEVFNMIQEYAKIIRKTAGYFVYDPQTEQVLDPLTENIVGLNVYQNTTTQVEQMKDNLIISSLKKPWWKFW